MSALKDLIDVKTIVTTPMEDTPVDAQDLATGFSSMGQLVKVSDLVLASLVYSRLARGVLKQHLREYWWYLLIH